MIILIAATALRSSEPAAVWPGRSPAMVMADDAMTAARAATAVRWPCVF